MNRLESLGALYLDAFRKNRAALEFSGDCTRGDLPWCRNQEVRNRNECNACAAARRVHSEANSSWDKAAGMAEDMLDHVTCPECGWSGDPLDREMYDDGPDAAPNIACPAAGCGYWWQ